MADLMLNLDEAATTTLVERWQRLAIFVDEANSLKNKAADDPTLAADPWVTAHDRWLDTFGRELAAVQTVYESVEGRARLSTDEIRTASRSAERLLDFITQARARIRVPEPA